MYNTQFLRVHPRINLIHTSGVQERESGQRLNIIIVSEGAIDREGNPITAEMIRQVTFITKPFIPCIFLKFTILEFHKGGCKQSEARYENHCSWSRSTRWKSVRFRSSFGKVAELELTIIPF